MRENRIPGYTIIEYKRRMLAGNEIYLDTTHLIKLRDKNIVSKTKSADSSKLNMCSLLRLTNERSPSILRNIPIDATIIATYPSEINNNSDKFLELMIKIKF